MGELLYNMANIVFGNGIAGGLEDWTTDVLKAMKDIFSNGYINDVYNLFAAIACSLLVIFFFQDLMNQASRDMFSFEKLVIGFIRMLIAFSVLVFLPDILKLLVDFAQGFVEMVQESGGIKDKLQEAVAETTGGKINHDEIKKAYEDEFDHLTKILHVMGAVMGMFIPWAIAMFAELMGKFIIASTAIMLMVKATFSPIAVVQIFEEGSRSSGMRYLKGLFAEALSFSIILVIIAASNGISATLISDEVGSGWTDPTKLNSLLGFGTLIQLIIPKLVIAGGMASGSKIAHEIMGA